MTEAIDFVMKGRIDGAEITPTTINFTRFNEFNQQVEDFVAGSDRRGTRKKLLLDTVFVQVHSGSYRLRVAMSIAMLASVEPEVRLLTRDNALSRLDEQRAKIVEKWQSKAKSHDDLSFEIRISRSDGRETPVIHIGTDTNFQRIEVSQWIPFETYFLGEVYDIGGENPNVHIRLSDTGETHIVQTDKDTLRNLEKNLLYQRTLLHVTGEQDQSGELRKLRLLEFVSYKPDYDEAALRRFIAEGREAWADVPDAAAWVRDLRGG